MLSPGEMQRLSFARLFYHKPDCAGIHISVQNIYGLHWERNLGYFATATKSRQSYLTISLRTQGFYELIKPKVNYCLVEIESDAEYANF